MNLKVHGRLGQRPARRRFRVGCSLLGLGLLAGACVTTYEDVPFVDAPLESPDLAVPVTIPLGTAEVSPAERPMLELYNGVLLRLEQAVADRDLAGVQSLLDGYERANLPPWVKDRLRGYRAISHGLAFQRHASSASTLQLVAGGGEGVLMAPAVALAEAPSIGEAIRCEFAMGAPAEPVRLGGRSDPEPTGFAVGITVEDFYVDGGSGSHKLQDFVWVPTALELRGDVVLRLPIGLDVPAGDAVQRIVHIRIDLMPGYVEAGGWRAPVQRTSVAACSFTQWPKGYEAIRKAPLATLREALRLGDAAHFPHVFLAAVFSRGEDREVALGLLIDQVRLGTEPQAKVAMAALRTTTGMTQSVGDRDAWLAWWQLRH